MNDIWKPVGFVRELSSDGLVADLVIDDPPKYECIFCNKKLKRPLVLLV